MKVKRKDQRGLKVHGTISHTPLSGDELICDLLVYLWNSYDKNNREMHFSASRATKMVFLVDWFYSRYNKDNWKQLTQIGWYFHVYGPYVDLTSMIHEKFYVESICNKTLFKLKEVYEGETIASDNLSDDVKEMCKKVINDTQSLGYVDFINYVYRIPAVELSKKHTIIQIESLAKIIYE